VVDLTKGNTERKRWGGKQLSGSCGKVFICGDPSKEGSTISDFFVLTIDGGNAILMVERKMSVIARYAVQRSLSAIGERLL
jgi:hypothetical protein